MFLDGVPAVGEFLFEIFVQVPQDKSSVMPDGVIAGIERKSVRCQFKHAFTLLARTQHGAEVVKCVAKSGPREGLGWRENRD